MLPGRNACRFFRCEKPVFVDGYQIAAGTVWAVCDTVVVVLVKEE